MLPNRHSLVENSRLKTPAGNPRLCLLVWLLALVMGSAMPAGAQEKPNVSEYQLKAVFLPKFPLFVQWPGQDSLQEQPEFVIGILGKNPFGQHLENTCRNQKFGNRSFKIKYCLNVDEAATCQMVFISESEKKWLPDILDRLGKANVLTVSDMPDFIQSGGMIGLVTENQKVALEINLDSTRQAGLRIEPQLLKLARTVKTSAKNTPSQGK